MKMIVPLAAAAALCLGILAVPRSLGHEGSTSATAAEDADVVTVYSAGLQGLFVDPRDAGVAGALAMLDERMLELRLDFESEHFPSEAVQLVYDALAQPVCLRVGPDRVQLSVLCASEDQAAGMTAATDGLLREAGVASRPAEGQDGRRVADTPLGPLHFGVLSSEASGRVLFVFGRGAVRDESFRFAGNELPRGVRPAFHVSYDGAGVGELLRPFVSSQGVSASQAWRAFEFLGLVGEGSPRHTWSLGFGSSGAMSVARTEGFVPLARRRGLLATEPLGASAFRRVPPDATLVRLQQVRLGGLLSLLDGIAPGTSAEVRQGLRDMTGVDVQSELLELLGPTVGVYWSVGTGGGGLASTVVFAEVTEPERLRGSLERIGRFVEAAAAFQADGRVKLRSWSHAGADCTTIAFPGLPVPLELSYAVAGGALYGAASQTALMVALDRSADDSTILDHPDVAALPAGSLERLNRFGFFDAPRFAERGYGTSNLIAAGLANAVRSPYDPDREPGRLMPPLPALMEGARAWVGLGRLEGADLVEHGVWDPSWMLNASALAGTPLTLDYSMLMAVGMASSVAIPNLMSARTSANENAAIATLRSLASAQAQCRYSAALDLDGDGEGEYGFLGELAGVRPLRVAHGGAAAWGRAGQGELSPPMLPTAWGQGQPDGRGGSLIERSGYLFQLWLPGSGGVGVTEPDGERVPVVDVEGAERAWCAYAWPAQPGSTGLRAFFINQDGDLLQTSNHGGLYGGNPAEGGRAPAFDAALSGHSVLAPAAVGANAGDGAVWVPLQ